MKLLDISTPKHPEAFAIVDDEDYADLSRFKWHLAACGYPARNLPRPAKGIEYLHRRLMNNPAGLVDHANSDPLDNRRENLRITDKRGNAANMRCKARCGLKGVTFHPQSGKWRARIMDSGKQISLGLYASREDAHAEYVKAAEARFGEFARAK